MDFSGGFVQIVTDSSLHAPDGDGIEHYPGFVLRTTPFMRPRVALIESSVLEVLAARASVELGRVAAVRPALEKRCERAEGILAGHAAAPRAGLIRAQFRGDDLVGYLVRGSGGAVYRVEAKGSWRCSCPDHHGRHRRRSEGSRACKHGLACWALWRAASGAQLPEVLAVVKEIEGGEARAGDASAA